MSEVDKVEDSTVLAGSITRAIKRSDAYQKLADRARLNRGWGDVFGYMLVASGRAEVMLDPTISIWDIAGVAPIVREAGGYFGNWAGEKTIGGPDACATNGKLRDEVLGILKNETRR